MPGGHDVSATDAWRRLVDVALRDSVDVVLLSGDVADQDNKFWEAVGPLEAGVNKLAAAGIEVVAVSGNHDHDVLPRLAAQLPDGFTLLGKGGTWQRHTLRRDGRAVLHVDGWSFPGRYVERDPTLDYHLPHADDAPTIGLLHGDLDDAASPYAPLAAARLRSLGPAAWLLGHLHTPRLLSDHACWLLYPGSPQALDFGETGVHGLWLLDVDSHLHTPRQVSLSSARYVLSTLDLTGVDTIDDANNAVLNHLTDVARQAIDAGGGELKVLAMRLRVTGETSLADKLPSMLTELVQDYDATVDGVSVGVDRFTCDALPPLDLDELRTSHTPPGVLAAVLLDASPDHPAARRVAAALNRIDRSAVFRPLDDEPVAPTDATADRARETLRQLLAEAAS